MLKLLAILCILPSLSFARDIAPDINNYTVMDLLYPDDNILRIENKCYKTDSMYCAKNSDPSNCQLPTENLSTDLSKGHFSLYKEASGTLIYILKPNSSKVKEKDLYKSGKKAIDVRLFIKLVPIPCSIKPSGFSNKQRHHQSK